MYLSTDSIASYAAHFMPSCNRYDAQLKARESLHHRREAVLRDCKDWEEMSKFLHYYERFKEHIKSYEVNY